VKPNGGGNDEPTHDPCDDWESFKLAFKDIVGGGASHTKE